MAKWVCRWRPGRGCRLLCSRGLVVVARNLENLQALFPHQDDRIEPQEPNSSEVTGDDIKKFLNEPVSVAAPGPPGIRVDHLLQIINSGRQHLKDDLVSLLTNITTQAVVGRWPQSCLWLNCLPAAASLLCVKRAQISVLDVACNCLSRYVLQQSAAESRDYLPEEQKGSMIGKVQGG